MDTKEGFEIDIQVEDLHSGSSLHVQELVTKLVKSNVG